LVRGSNLRLLIASQELKWSISTAPLNPLRDLQVQPIKVIISDRPKSPNLGVGFVLRCFQRLS